MKKKRIIFVGSFIKPGQYDNIGGVMFACQTIINSSISDEVEWILIDSTSPTVANSNFILRLFRALRRICQLIYKLILGQADAVLIFCVDGFSFYEKGLMACLGKLFGKRVYLSPRAGKIEDDLKKNFFSTYFRLVLNSCDVVICQSEYWKNLFQKNTKGNKENKFVVIQNGIDTSRYHGKIQSETSLIKIFFMGWLVKEKGIWELLYAFNKLVQEYPNCELQIAGKGPEWEEIQLFIVKNHLQDKIKLVGWITKLEKTNQFSQADIFVLPSWFEGLPNALLEAMASGLASIATDIGAIPDVIQHKKTGILIPKQNADKLYEAMKTLVLQHDFRFQMGIKARNYVIEHNDVQTYVDGLRKIVMN